MRCLSPDPAACARLLAVAMLSQSCAGVRHAARTYVTLEPPPQITFVDSEGVAAQVLGLHSPGERDPARFYVFYDACRVQPVPAEIRSLRPDGKVLQRIPIVLQPGRKVGGFVAMLATEILDDDGRRLYPTSDGDPTHLMVPSAGSIEVGPAPVSWFVQPEAEDEPAPEARAARARCSRGP